MTINISKMWARLLAAVMIVAIMPAMGYLINIYNIKSNLYKDIGIYNNEFYDHNKIILLTNKYNTNSGRRLLANVATDEMVDIELRSGAARMLSLMSRRGMECLGEVLRTVYEGCNKGKQDDEYLLVTILVAMHGKVEVPGVKNLASIISGDQSCDMMLRHDAVRLYSQWATKEDVDVLIKYYAEYNKSGVRDDIIRAIERLYDLKFCSDPWLVREQEFEAWIQSQGSENVESDMGAYK